MDQATKNEIDAKLLKERDAEVSKVLDILGAGAKETLKDVAMRRMWQAMPEAMKNRQQDNTAH